MLFFARKYFNESTTDENTRSYYWLAHMYEHGMGVEEHHDKAIEYLTAGKSKGDLLCAYTLNLYEYQNGTFVNKVIAMIKRVALTFRVVLIAIHDLDDMRIADFNKTMQKSDGFFKKS